MLHKLPQNRILFKQLSSLVSERPNLTTRFENVKAPLPALIIPLLNQWLDRLQSVLRRLAKGSIGLSSQAPKLREIANTIHHTTEKQKQKSEDIARDSDTLKNSVENIVQSTREAVNRSRNMLDLTAEAKDYGQASTSQTETVKQMMDETIQIIDRLQTQSRKINSVMDTINDIANRTHVISLNASIQAANAGEAGLGFSVIAREVRTLASHIMDATGEIQNEVSDLHIQIKKAVGFVSRVEDAVDENHHVITQADASLQKVSHHHEVLHQNLNNIAGATEMQSSATLSILEKIRDISTLSEEQSSEEKNLLQVVNILNKHCDGLLLEVGAFRLQQHENAKELTLRIAEHPDIITGDRSVKENRLRETARQNAWVELLYITDSQGRQIVSNISNGDVTSSAHHNDGFGQDWRDREWFSAVKESQSVFISDIYRSKATDDFCFTVSTPVKNSQGSFIGVLAIDVNFSQMLAG